ncbi:hypothetical protein GCU69_13290 [Streptomyces lycii]|uniref:Uncharacterized protein n=1 Tax=Streptomyces lycii TaxID=2654337 RepID=A0ABQ7FJV9_9ACTN|nr:hypothetical protein GCU69_13290 [Streptomyces lycii]
MVLVKPGDVLVFGNVGDVDAEQVSLLGGLLRDLLPDTQVVLFAEDIDMAAVPCSTS